ncbi:MAG: hypothetical protein M4579_006563 [Chaenotheca gracillima]|nr:MAG: hypothetical protein M4579_006563 [Chaenotheca gracillima]
MASTFSLGVHEPSALPYLEAESILPHGASKDQYKWLTFEDEESTTDEDELLVTDHSVVWSQGGIIKRVYRFEVEKEKVLHAILTWFSTPEVRSQQTGSGSGQSANSPNDRFTDSKERPNGKDKTHQFSRARALVVFLRTQAHVYFFSGTSHIVHLPFEVDSVHAAPRGLILQRKHIAATHGPNPPAPLAPPNSFVSFATQPWSASDSQSFASPRQIGGFPQLSLPHQSGQRSSRNSGVSVRANDDLPRLFSLTDPLAEMGLVVPNPAQENGSGRNRLSFMPSNVINPSEEMVFVSSPLASNSSLSATLPGDGVVLALTANYETHTYTIWTVNYPDLNPTSSKAKLPRISTSGVQSRPRSSFGPGTGAATPVGPGKAVRESFGGPRNHGAGIAYMDPAGHSHEDTQNVSNEELASSLDPDFGSSGLPARKSRRVSSLLARADLSTNRDRAAFSDLATGHIPATVNAQLRRGESLGHYGSRASLGTNNSLLRRSMPASESFSRSHNRGGSEIAVDEMLEELNTSGDFGGFENLGINEPTAGLRREVILTKVESVPMALEHFQEATHRNQPKVFVTSSPATETSDREWTLPITMCIANAQDRRLLILNLNAYKSPAITAAQPPSRKARQKKRLLEPYLVHLLDVKRGSDVLDAAKITDGRHSRILVLSETADGYGELTLQSPWSTTIRLQLPEKLVMFNPYQGDYLSALANDREGSVRRVLPRPRALKSLEGGTSRGRVDVVDSDGKRHRIQVQMQPRSKLIRDLLGVCAWVLPGSEKGGDGIFSAWVDIRRWLEDQPGTSSDLEWTAFVVAIMCMAVDFIPTPTKRDSSRRKKRSSGLLRSSSGAAVDMSKWNDMVDSELTLKSQYGDYIAGAAWNWVSEQDAQPDDQDAREGLGFQSPARGSGSKGAAQTPRLKRKHRLVVDCTGMARDFLRTPAGKAASGKEGYLPTAENKKPELRSTALATVLVGLHLFREELKLCIATSEASSVGVAKLLPVLAQLGGWLKWDAWNWQEGSYYKSEDVHIDDWLFDEGLMTKVETVEPPFNPPSIYDWVWQCARKESQLESFMTLFKIAPVYDGPREDQISQGTGVQGHWTALTPRTPVIIEVFENLAKGQLLPTEIISVLTMARVDSKFLDTLPEGILIPLREAVVNAQANPPTIWSKEALDLAERDDLSVLLSNEKKKWDVPRSLLPPTHEALRDVHNVCNSTFDTEIVGSFDNSAEFDRQVVTRLIFREDRRFIEASRLLQSAKPSVARCVPEPDWSESDLLDAQKEVVQIVAIRTLAIPSSRGLLYFSARLPLLTERFPIPGFNLSCVMKPSGNTVSADRSAFTEEKVGWAFFHAGVAAGLSISREAKGIDTSWIVYNKPSELSNRHAGFLLALGLNGHLKSIAKWVAFKYLTPKHTMTSIGLLLGLSASYLGTMDTLITRLLSVHVTRMLPPGAAELNLSPLTQTTGMMGIGLLYCNTQHRRMSEVMLSEVENVEIEDSSMPVEALRDEGYRLAAGFALGFINLGKGRDFKGLHDMRIVERLLALAVGTKKVGITHVLDKTTAAATVAIALIFMKSNDEALARKVDIPDTILQFDNIRPDVFLLRTVAKHLIMWDKIQATLAWIKGNLPLELQNQASMKGVRSLRSEHLPFFNIVAGLCFSIALRFAGSGSLRARDVLVHYLDQFTRICRLSAINYDQKLARSTVRNCQDLIALSAATVMAGTGDLVVFRRLRLLHGRASLETPYGSHLVGHMAIGVLFLGGGNYTLGTSNLAIASLLCAFYPLTPNTILDNQSHLQAFRHFWVLAAEARCIIVRDVDTHRPVSIPMSITLRTGEELKKTAPCLLPELIDIATIATASPEHWRVVLDFAKNASHRATFINSQTIYVRRRAAHDVTSSSSVFQATLQALNDNETERHPLEWLLNLPSFSTLDKSERALVIPPDAGNPVQASTDSTLVDTRLVFEKLCLSGDKADRLRNLKLLFAWAERADAEGQKLKWMTSETVDRLRAAVWMLLKDDEP